MPDHYVFGGYYRMYMYQARYPAQYILLPCFFYGIFATLLAKCFKKQPFEGQLLFTILLIILTVLFSSPVGGMLWVFHHMQVRNFPDNWLEVIVKIGAEWGFELGWFIVAFSIPYAYLGAIICFFLTRYGAKILAEKETGIAAI